MHGLFSLSSFTLKELIFKACPSSCKGRAGELALQQTRNLKGRGLVFIKPKMEFQRGTCQCQMHGEVRELRAENCVLGFGPLLQWSGQRLGAKAGSVRRSRKTEEWTVWSLGSPPEGKHV